MCVTSLLCGPQAELWPFYGFLCKRFSLYIKVYQTMPMLIFRVWATCGYFEFPRYFELIVLSLHLKSTPLFRTCKKQSTYIRAQLETYCILFELDSRACPSKKFIHDGQKYCWFARDVTGPCWWSRTKAFFSSEAKLYFHVNFSSKISIVLTPNMAALATKTTEHSKIFQCNSIC